MHVLQLLEECKEQNELLWGFCVSGLMLLNRVRCLPILSAITSPRHICTRCFRQRQNKSTNRQGASTPALFPFFGCCCLLCLWAQCCFPSLQTRMFLIFRMHDEKGLNCRAYLIFDVSSLCCVPRQSAKFSLFWCLFSEEKSPLFFGILIYFKICCSEWKQVTLFSSSSCLFSSSVCWVKVCLPRVNWEIKDSFSSSCLVSSPNEKKLNSFRQRYET